MAPTAPAELDLRAAAIGVVGTGRLGSALAEALTAAGYRVCAVASHSRASARALAERLAGTEVLASADLVARTDAVWLVVPDGEIARVAAALPWRAGQAVVHCAGRLGLDALDAARARGAQVGCLHPLQSFPERARGGTRFRGIACGVEADAALAPALTRLCADLGATCFSLAGVERAAYHAAAVFASNYLVALHAAAERAWTLAGLPATSARAALAPLTLGAADAISRLPLGQALTGPIARGDAATIVHHLEALGADPMLAELYRRLGDALLALPLALSAQERAALARVLQAK